MSGKKDAIRRFDMDHSSLLLFPLVFCILALIFTGTRGSDVLFYAWFPMSGAVLAGIVGHTCVEAFMAEQIQRRMKRGRAENALVLLKAALLVSLLWALLILILFGISANLFGESVLGFSLTSPLLRTFAPAAALSCLIGCLRGFLRGIGQARFSRTALWLETVLTLFLGMLFGFFSAGYGEKAGALLLNEDISAVYCGCGIAVGLDLAALMTTAILIFLCRLSWVRNRQDLSGRDVFLRDAERTESCGGLMRYMLQKTLSGAGVALMLFLGMTIVYRFWLTGQENTTTAILTSVWGGFAGIGLPVTAGSALLLSLPLTALTARAIRDAQSGNRRALRSRMNILLNLSAYSGIPACAFLFGAAKILVYAFPNLTFTAQESAILTIRTGCFLVFLIMTAVLLGHFFWCSMQRRVVVTAAAAGFFVQVVLTVVLSLLGTGIAIGTWTLDAMLLVFLLVLYLLGSRSLLRGLGTAWLGDDVLIAVCAALAAVPVLLLADYLLEVMPAAAALMVSAVLFVAVYVLLSIILRAADLSHLNRLPGGGWIVSLAVLMGIADREET